MLNEGYAKFCGLIGSTVNRSAKKRFTQQFIRTNVEYKAIMKAEYNGNQKLADKLTDQCLAVCGHANYQIDHEFLRNQSERVLAYISCFVSPD